MSSHIAPHYPFPHEPVYGYKGDGEYRVPGAGHREPNDLLREIREMVFSPEQPSNPYVSRAQAWQDLDSLVREFIESFDAHQMVLYQP